MYNQGLVSNSFTYEGKVTFKFKRNNKVYNIHTHNAGTKLLVDTISKALAGGDVRKNIPKYLHLIYKIKETDDSGNVISLRHGGNLIKDEVPFVGVVWGEIAKEDQDKNNDKGCLLLSATITASNKNEINLNENAVVQLHMLDQNKNTLAIIQDGSLYSLYDSLQDGTDAIIEWRMIFSNK